MISRYSFAVLSLLLASSNAFAPLAHSRRGTHIAYQFANGDESPTLAVDSPSQQQHIKKHNNKMKVDKNKVKRNDPSNVEFVCSTEVYEGFDGTTVEAISPNSFYPFATMLQGSARYIADHAGEVAVFHIPGDLIEREGFPKMMEDISLAWLLGMKIVIVLGGRSDVDGCSLDFEFAHECHNSLRVTDEATLRQVEEEAGFVRFEVERRLNKCLRRQSGITHSSKDAPTATGNVVGGNYYTAQEFGVVGGTDYKHTGYTSKVHVNNIKQALANSDVVLLTTIAPSRSGELVNVNGNHLAASVAKSLEAHKLIFMSSYGKVLRLKGENTALQDIPLSMAQAILKYYQVEVHRSGFVAFEKARNTLEAGAVELLLHMAWANWAVDQGVTRAHIVNPGDGALLEELFTAKHGANTCLFNDDELDEEMDDTILDGQDLEIFMAVAAGQNRQ